MAAQAHIALLLNIFQDDPLPYASLESYMVL